MRIEKYICDFCKKEIERKEVREFYTNIGRHELCDSCYNKAFELKEEYEEKCNNLYNEFKDKITLMRR